MDLENAAAEATKLLEQGALEHDPSFIAKCFENAEQLLNTQRFEDVSELVIKLLAALVPVASMEQLMTSGLVESIFVLFLNRPETSDDAVRFLDRFFERPDIDDVFEDIVMVTVVNFANFSPPSLPLWRLMCKFMCKFGEKIENMVDFSAVESNGMLPIFTRSLIWTLRIIYQHPPEDESVNEEVFWDLWDVTLRRYCRDMNKEEPTPVILLFKSLMNEIRLSLYWALKTTKNKDGSFASARAPSVWRQMFTIYQGELIEFLEQQFPCRSLEIAVEILLPVSTEEQAARLRQISLAQTI